LWNQWPHGLAVDISVTQEFKPQDSFVAAYAEDAIDVRMTEYSQEPLNPKLFEVPPGFKKVRVLFNH
jgi:hypothetical protein